MGYERCCQVTRGLNRKEKRTHTLLPCLWNQAFLEILYYDLLDINKIFIYIQPVLSDSLGVPGACINPVPGKERAVRLWGAVRGVSPSQFLVVLSSSLPSDPRPCSSIRCALWGASWRELSPCSFQGGPDVRWGRGGWREEHGF